MEEITLGIGLKIKNEIEFINEVLTQAVKIADEIVIGIDSESTDGTLQFIQSFCERKKEYSYFINEGSLSNTEQKNAVRHKLKSDWILFLDGDEILSDNCVDMKKYILEADKEGVDTLDLQGYHFIYNLAVQDNMVPEHIWNARLFKNKPEIFFEGRNHEITVGYKKLMLLKGVVIWHMGYVKHLDKIMNRYHENIDNGYQIHTPLFLEKWKNDHLLGKYPVRPIDFRLMPLTLKQKFYLEDVDDIIYFHGRDKIEVKHYIDVKQWIDFFKPNTVLFLGCGFGQRVKTCLDFGVSAIGIEKSVYAVNNSPVKDFLVVGDITKIPLSRESNNISLVVAYDVLEHLEDKELDKALKEMYRISNKHVLISVPFIGNPSLEADSTHKQFMTRDEWEQKVVSAGFKIIPTPKNFMFGNQILIGEKK